jgi:hypothetical protein
MGIQLEGVRSLGAVAAPIHGLLPGNDAPYSVLMAFGLFTAARDRGPPGRWPIKSLGDRQ